MVFVLVELILEFCCPIQGSNRFWQQKRKKKSFESVHLVTVSYGSIWPRLPLPWAACSGLLLTPPHAPGSLVVICLVPRAPVGALPWASWGLRRQALVARCLAGSQVVASGQLWAPLGSDCG